MITSILALALVLAPSGESSWIELTAGLRLDVRTLNGSFPTYRPPQGLWLGGGGTLAITAFAGRVVDDDAAPPLQPFLQRVARFSVDADGGGASIRWPIIIAQTQDPNAPDAVYQSSLKGVRVAASGEGYPRPWLFLAGRVDIDYETWGHAPFIVTGGFAPADTLGPGLRLESSELKVTPSVHAGVRWHDVLVSAGWSVTPFRVGSEQMHVRFWGGAFVGAHAIVKRFVALDGSVEVLDGGAVATLGATAYLRRRLGLLIRAEGGHGAFADASVTYDRAGGEIGLSWWFGPRLGLALMYSATWQHSTPVAGFGVALTNISFVESQVSLRLTSRPPVMPPRRSVR